MTIIGRDGRAGLSMEQRAMRLGLACAFALIAGVAAANAQSTGSFTREPNMDRSGNDIRKIELEASQDVAACEELCRGTPGCVAFTYVKRNTTVPVPICRLKDTAPTAHESSCCTSGVRAK